MAPGHVAPQALRKPHGSCPNISFVNSVAECGPAREGTIHLAYLRASRAFVASMARQSGPTPVVTGSAPHPHPAWRDGPQATCPRGRAVVLQRLQRGRDEDAHPDRDRPLVHVEGGGV